MKTKSNFAKKKKINNFGSILLNRCLTEQFLLPASEYTNKCNKIYFSLCKK